MNPNIFDQQPFIPEQSGFGPQDEGFPEGVSIDENGTPPALSAETSTDKIVMPPRAALEEDTPTQRLNTARGGTEEFSNGAAAKEKTQDVAVDAFRPGAIKALSRNANTNGRPLNSEELRAAAEGYIGRTVVGSQPIPGRSGAYGLLARAKTRSVDPVTRKMFANPGGVAAPLPPTRREHVEEEASYDEEPHGVSADPRVHGGGSAQNDYYNPFDGVQGPRRWGRPR